MNKIPATVLITTANNPPENTPHLEMINPVERRVAAKAALFFWAAQGIQKIIVADATESQLLTKSEVDEISLLGASIEQISYSQNTHQVVSKGKGFAEGELLRFALEHSRLLADEEVFFKSTGKTFVRNFPEIYKLIDKSNVDTVFWRYVGDGLSFKQWADCRFYLANRDFATSKLIPTYLQSDDQIGTCEYYLFQMLSEHFKQATGLRPLISGFQGSTGGQYFDGSLGSLDLNLPCWLNERL